MPITKLRRAINQVSVVRDERGLTTVEYVILLVVIAIMSVVGWHKFGSSVNQKLTDSAATFDSAVVPTSTTP